MRCLLLLVTASSLVSCISFPRAAHTARTQENAPDSVTTVVEDGPAIKRRDNFRDAYFR